MQSSRPVALLLLVVLAVGGFLAFQFLVDDAPPVVPGTGDAPASAKVDSSTASSEKSIQPASATVDSAGDGAVREAVVSDPSKSDLPSIVGIVVGPGGAPIEDAEIICVPGTLLSQNFQDFDFEATDINFLDPQSMIAHMEGQQQQRVTVRSDAEGRFRVRVDGDSDKISLRVLARGYLALDRPVARPKERDTDVGSLELAIGAVISGRVVNPNGKPIEGASVARMLEIENQFGGDFDFNFPGMDMLQDLRAGDRSVTDAQGYFELAHTEAGEFSLRVRHPEHPSVKRTGLVVAQGRALTDLVLTMRNGAEIRGVVLGAPADASGLRVMAAAKPKPQPNNPANGLMGMIGGATEMMGEMGMAFGERECEIGEDGSFVLRGLKGARVYRVWIGQAGRGFAGSSVISERVEAAAGRNDVELNYDPGVAVTFVAVDDQTGKPIERLWVRDQLLGGDGFANAMAFMPSDAREQRYPEGKVTVANLRPKDKQTLKLTLDGIGYESFEREGIELPSNGSVDLGVLRLTPKPVLQVKVVAGRDGRPLAGARVNLEERQEGGGRNPFARFQRMSNQSGPTSGRTDAEGTCRLNVIDGEAVDVVVTQRGFASATVAVEPSDAPVREQLVRMVVGGIVEVTVVDAEQKPIAGVAVQHRAPGGDVGKKNSDADGLVRFEHLAPGSHAFRVAKSDAGMFAFEIARATGGQVDEEPWTNAEVVNREVTALSLEKKPTAQVTGVVRENGVPLAGARVTFREGPAPTGAEGVASGMLSSMMGQMGQGKNRRSKTGDDGVFALTELPFGEHNLLITHRGRAMPTTIAVTLRDGENRVDVDLDMTTIRGFVRDPDGNPVDGAKVSVSPKGNAQGGQMGRMVSNFMPGMGGGKSQRTDAGGLFELRGVSPGTLLVVRATADDYADATTEIQVEQGQAKDGVALQLGRAGSIKVTVADAGRFAAVTAKFVGTTEGEERVDPAMKMLQRGKCTLKGLRPGTWEVTYQGMRNRGDGEAPKRTVEVVAGQEAFADF